MSNYETYKKQETILILLNIAVLAALFFVHISFIALLGRPGFVLLITLAVRFLILIFELLWVQRLSKTTSQRTMDIHVHLSIILNISFGFLAAFSGGTADSHYSVLMIIPILSAAYRFSIFRTLIVTGITILLTFLEVWLFFRAHPPADVSEYFEAATVSLVFLVVAIVVWLLVGNLRNEEEKLGESIEDLRKLQEKLVSEEKLAAVGQLSSAIAHEIRNPVTMIASSLKMAEKHEPGSAMRLEMFKIATEEAKRLETMTTDFLTFARTRPPVRKSVAIVDLLNYIASLSKARLIEKEITIKVECDSELRFEIDETQMQQALLNLLTNAINASPPDSRITIGAESRADRSIIYLANEGTAIPKDMIERIFEPFFTNGARGTGLGLSIVRNIARAHNGEVFLTNNDPDNIRFELIF